MPQTLRDGRTGPGRPPGATVDHPARPRPGDGGRLRPRAETAVAAVAGAPSPGLPVTGAAAGVMAAVAGALVAAGAVLLVVTRRRRIRFTA
ncbi:LPXTG cell wall anchor domain-containing protein [Micromonospora sp. MP36]|nr:LPXTG cell wall anchor domain-containing protein [Micromonospora sp. MP36]